MSTTVMSVIIVSWNVKDLLRQTLNSLFNTTQELAIEVIVVDNASKDGSADMVQTDFSQVTLIRNKENKGFAAACHQGARVAKGEYFLFLNDDTHVFDHTLTNTHAYIKTHPEVGVLGCKILNIDQSVQPSVRSFPNLYSQTIILLKLHHFFPILLKKYLQHSFDYSLTQKVEQVMGAFFLVPRTHWDILKGFDEQYHIWFEEVDFCKRTLAHGKEVIYFSDACIIHIGGASFHQLKALAEQRIFNRSLWHYARTHWNAWQVTLLVCLFPLNYILTALVQTLEFLHIKK
jgi:GT2 family glycosyltransferase